MSDLTWAVSVATLTGVFRIVSDSHYLSDVFVGAGVGWFYGYIMPKLLHYKDGPLEPRDRKNDVLWMPSFSPVADGGVLSVGAVF